jgi:hypothetical protein
VNYKGISLAMLIESRRHPAEKLPRIQASRAIVVQLQRGRRDEEQERRKRNLPKLGRRRWNGGERAEDRSDLSAMSRRGAAASSTVVSDVGEAEAPAGRWATAEGFPLCPSVQR